jgi:hypothetical protein
MLIARETPAPLNAREDAGAIAQKEIPVKQSVNVRLKVNTLVMYSALKDQNQSHAKVVVAVVCASQMARLLANVQKVVVRNKRLSSTPTRANWVGVPIYWRY